MNKSAENSRVPRQLLAGANFFLASTALAAAAGICLLAFRRWETLFSPVNLFYCLVLGAGGIVCAWALTWPRPGKVVFAAATCLSGLGLVFLEIALELKVSLIDQQKMVIGTWRQARKLQAKGIDAYPLILPTHFLYSNGLEGETGRLFPLSGLANRLTSGVNEGNYWPKFTSDEHGFNNPRRQHTTNHLDVVLIGDSFTQGVTVMESENVAGWLRKAGYRVLNLGEGGNGPLLELAALGEYGLPLKPKAFLWFFYEGNDFADLQSESKCELLMKYLDDQSPQQLQRRQREVEGCLLEFYHRFLERGGAIQGKESVFTTIPRLCRIRMAFLGALKEVGPTGISTKDLDLFKTVLQQAKQRSEASGARFYFVYLPDVHRLSSPRVAQTQEENARKIHGLLRSIDVPVIDFLAILNTLADPLSVFPNRRPVHNRGQMHYNAYGFRLLSQAVESRLSQDRVLPKP